MNGLTSLEIKVLNSISNLRSRTVSLGTLLNNVVNSLKVVGTPVNAVNATNVLTLSGVVKHGETLTINNPLVPGTDTFEFLATASQTKSSPSNIAIDIWEDTVSADVVLTITNQPTSGDKMTLGAKEYTFVPFGTDTADGEISIGTDLASAKTNIVAAINGTDEFNTPHPLVTAGTFSGNNLTITAIVGGSVGNSITSTETFTAGTNVFDTAALNGGIDCPAATAVTAIVTAVTDNGTQGVSAVDGAGDTVSFTVTLAGVSGNNISTSKTLSNGAFTTTNFANGVNGTLGSVHKFMVDGDYLYVTVAENTVSGKNWRRIDVGDAY